MVPKNKKVEHSLVDLEHMDSQVGNRNNLDSIGTLHRYWNYWIYWNSFVSPHVPRLPGHLKQVFGQCSEPIWLSSHGQSPDGTQRIRVPKRCL